jgi:hypothetical protein
MITKDRIRDLIESRPEFQFSSNQEKKAISLFGNTNSFSIGKGWGNKLGTTPTFMQSKSKFGYSNFARARGGM